MRLGKPALIHSFSSFVSKISGVIRDIFLAGFLGTGVLSDIFFIALKLPVSFRRSLSEETFNSAFIPLYGRFSDQSDTRLKHHFALKVLFFALIIFIPFIIICEIFMPDIVKIFGSSIDTKGDFEILVTISRIIFPYLIFIVISSVFIAILNANSKFALGSGLPIILNIAIIVSIAMYPILGETKITLLAWSVIIGGILQSIILFLAIDKAFWYAISDFSRNSVSLKKFFTLFWPTFLSAVLFQANMLIGVIVASYEAGAVTYLYYAERIYFLPLTLIAIAISTILIPNLSFYIRNSKPQQALNFQLKAYEYCMITILPIASLLFVLSDEIISLFFQRGEFSFISVRSTADALKVFALGLPALALVRILVPYFFAIEKPKIPLLLSIISVVLNIILTLLFFRYFGFLGIALAVSCAAWFNVILLFIAHYKSNFFTLNKELIRFSFKCLFLSLLLFFASNVILLNTLAMDLSKISQLFIVLFPSFILFILFVYFFEPSLRRQIKTTIEGFLKKT
tara:strand:- start:1358 stop:2896 length:1539 start_codon:yes stop_codon:yes gene_type:complete